jgi:predicted hotdog family 3-hydroxylacyl-ACP dehydratase
MRISHAELARLIPHCGAMCLLDSVLVWSDDAITCTASSHRDPNNPMRRNGLLHMACGIEYASQAIAAHGTLAGSAGVGVRRGYLASVRDLVLHSDRLDLIEDALLVQARRVLNMDLKSLYDFTIIANGKAVIEGRAAVVLDGVAS